MKPKHTAQALVPILLTCPLIPRGDQPKFYLESATIVVKVIDPQVFMPDDHTHKEPPGLFLARASYGFQISSSGAFYPTTTPWANW